MIKTKKCYKPKLNQSTWTKYIFKALSQIIIYSFYFSCLSRLKFLYDFRNDCSNFVREKIYLRNLFIFAAKFYFLTVVDNEKDRE